MGPLKVDLVKLLTVVFDDYFVFAGDNVTKQYCGAVLSSLSFYEAARVTLCELGAIAALKGAFAQIHIQLS